MSGSSPRRLAFGRAGRLVVAAVVGSVLLAACASNDSTGASASSNAPKTVQNGLVGDQGDAGAPVKGGTLTYATYSFITSFDPAATQSAGASGGSEMAAIYDVLMRYDAASNTFQPQLAQSLQASADQQTWTLKLRDGVKFSDGTPLTSQAVVASINRFNTARGLNAQVWTSSVTKMDAPDPSTVVFSLARPWREFPSLLTGGQGMIVAPSAIVGGKVANAIGAGPFTVQRFAPNEELALKARPDYWGGAPNLDTVRFIPIVGDQAKADALKSGGIQMAYMRTASVVSQTRDAGYPGYVDTSSLGSVISINNRAGHAGADVRVRQAMAYATNVDTFNQRASGGKGLPGSEIFQSWSPWHNDVGGINYDAAKAKQLLDAAKKDGFNGEITYMGLNDPAAQQSALAMQAMLQAVGFTVKINYQNSVADLVKNMYVNHDFDISFGAYSLYDPAPYVRLFSSLQSTSTSNALGYANLAMDAALLKVQSATSDETKKAALAEVQKLVNDTVPFLTLGAQATLIPWAKSVHGVTPSLDGIMLFGKAWIKS